MNSGITRGKTQGTLKNQNLYKKATDGMDEARKEKESKCLHGVQTPGMEVALADIEQLGETDWRGKINSLLDMMSIWYGH